MLLAVFNGKKSAMLNYFNFSWLFLSKWQFSPTPNKILTFPYELAEFFSPLCERRYYGQFRLSRREAHTYRRNDMIFWIFHIVHCHAFCMCHWPIGKDLDLSFIWGHHLLHLAGMNDQSISWILHYLLHRADETQQGRNSCPRLQFLAFSFDSIMSLSRYAFYVD